MRLTKTVLLPENLTTWNKSGNKLFQFPSDFFARITLFSHTSHKIKPLKTDKISENIKLQNKDKTSQLRNNKTMTKSSRDVAKSLSITILTLKLAVKILSSLQTFSWGDFFSILILYQNTCTFIKMPFVFHCIRPFLILFVLGHETKNTH